MRSKRSMRHAGRLAVSVASVTVLVAACGGTSSDQPNSTNTTNSGFDAASYFHGKTIRVITSSEPGGGTDAKARVVASYLGRYLPGHPKLQVGNVTPHVAGMNYEWGAPKDGTVIGVESNSLLEFELFNGANWNAAKFNYIGAIDSACPSVMMVSGSTGYKTIKDTENAQSPKLVTIMQAPNPASIEPYDISTMLFAEWLHQPLEVKRVADSGTSALNLAMQRGDINYARYGADWCRFPQSHPGWLKNQTLVPLLDVNAAGPGVPPPVIKQMGTSPPYAKEVLTKKQFDEWDAFVAAPRAGGSPILLPPGVPTNVTNALRQAYDKMVKDTKFKDAIGKAFGEKGSDLVYRSGTDYEKMQVHNRKSLYAYKSKLDGVKKELYNKYLS